MNSKEFPLMVTVITLPLGLHGGRGLRKTFYWQSNILNVNTMYKTLFLYSEHMQMSDQFEINPPETTQLHQHIYCL